MDSNDHVSETCRQSEACNNSQNESNSQAKAEFGSQKGDKHILCGVEWESMTDSQRTNLTGYQYAYLHHYMSKGYQKQIT